MFNYIKTHRKRWGLSQNELGYLIGTNHNRRISQLERGKVLPSYTEGLIFELLFESASHRLFPDIYTDIAATLEQRLDLLGQHFAEITQTAETENTNRRIRQVHRYLKELSADHS